MSNRRFALGVDMTAVDSPATIESKYELPAADTSELGASAIVTACMRPRV